MAPVSANFPTAAALGAAGRVRVRARFGLDVETLVRAESRFAGRRERPASSLRLPISGEGKSANGRVARPKFGGDGAITPADAEQFNNAMLVQLNRGGGHVLAAGISRVFAANVHLRILASGQTARRPRRVVPFSGIGANGHAGSAVRSRPDFSDFSAKAGANGSHCRALEGRLAGSRVSRGAVWPHVACPPDTSSSRGAHANEQPARMSERVGYFRSHRPIHAGLRHLRVGPHRSEQSDPTCEAVERASASPRRPARSASVAGAPTSSYDGGSFPSRRYGRALSDPHGIAPANRGP